MSHVKEMAVKKIIFWQKTVAMVSCDVTSSTEESLWQVVVPGISMPVSTNDKACACSTPGSKNILMTNEGLRQVLVQLCICADSPIADTS